MTSGKILGVDFATLNGEKQYVGSLDVVTEVFLMELCLVALLQQIPPCTAISLAMSNFTLQKAGFSHVLSTCSSLPTHLQQLEISASENQRGTNGKPRVISPFKSLVLSFCVLKQFLAYKMRLLS